MTTPVSLPRLKGFRFPREIIAYAVWAYHRFAMSAADVEDLLAERGVMVSRETVRLWVNRFGQHFANCIKRDRPNTADKWHLDEVVIPINGEKLWLWRAVDANGDVLDILVQKHRNAKAAKRFLKRLIDQFGTPRVIITPSQALQSNALPGNGQTAQLHKADQDSRSKRRSSPPQRLEQSGRGITSTNPKAREDYGSVQIAQTGPEVSLGP